MSAQDEETPHPQDEGKGRGRFHRFWRARYLIPAFVALLLLGLGGLYEYSTSPGFCRSCHIMEPYYQAWETSKHNFVKCVDCHYPPGAQDALWVKYQSIAQVAKFFTRTYSSKPFAEVEDASCLRSNCHAARLLEGELTYKGFVRFNHEAHLSERRAGKKLRCTSCHSQIVVGTHMVVTETTCFLCHFKGRRTAREIQPLAGCGTCHTAPDRPIRVGDVVYNHKDFVGARQVACQNCHQDVIQGEGRAPKDRCFDCHNKPEHLDRYKETRWLHDWHVSGKNIECSRCHEPIVHKLQKVAGHKPLDVSCETCHQAKHDIQRLLYMGMGGRGVPVLESPMFSARVDCVGCHIRPKTQHETETLFTATEDACVKCHGEAYRGMLAEWKAAIQKGLGEFRPKVEEAAAALRKAEPNPNTAEARRLFEQAEHNFKMVTAGNPVHNIYFAARLLAAANDQIDEMGRILGYPPMKMTRNAFVNGGYCATLCHDRVKVKLPEVLTWEGIRMPHLRHSTTAQIGCLNCHAFGAHKEVKVKISREECLACHHQALKAVPQLPCEGCHQRQVKFRAGKSLGEKTPVAGSMASLPCRACHQRIETGHREKDVEASCRACHPAPFVSVGKMWREEVAKGLRELEAGWREIQTVLKDRSGPAAAEARQLKAAADEILDPIAWDQSGGFHNYRYAVQLIGQARKRLEEARKTLMAAPDATSQLR